jgi:hypothetical protein
MQSGRAVQGVRNLGFRTENARTDGNRGELWAKRSWFGMDAERHRRKSSEEAYEEWKNKLEIMMSIASAIVRNEATEVELDASTCMLRGRGALGLAFLSIANA